MSLFPRKSQTQSSVALFGFLTAGAVITIFVVAFGFARFHNGRPEQAAVPSTAAVQHSSPELLASYEADIRALDAELTDLAPDTFLETVEDRLFVMRVPIELLEAHFQVLMNIRQTKERSAAYEEHIVRSYTHDSLDSLIEKVRIVADDQTSL